MSMNTTRQFIESGILELYVSGDTTAEETAIVEQMALTYPVITEEIHLIRTAVEHYAQLAAKEPDPTIKPFLLAVVDYTERIKAGETISFPPALHEQSTITDYGEWLNRKEMKAPANLPSLFAKIIGYTPAITTAIVWIKEMAPQEIHTNEIEKFLIVEGTCDITIGDEVHHLSAGDMLSIPLYKNHFVKVTSAVPCKVILQRIAA